MQSNVEKDAAALRAQVPTGLAEDVAVKRSPGAEITAQPVKPAARDVTVAKPPEENRLDRPTHPSRAYSLAYVAVFAGAALFATGRALGLRMREFAATCRRACVDAPSGARRIFGQLRRWIGCCHVSGLCCGGSQAAGPYGSSWIRSTSLK